MAKVLCESCGTSFLYDVVKNVKACPVCGKPLWEASSEDTENEDNVEVMEYQNVVEDDLMYFDEIETSYIENPDYNGVLVYCKECGKIDSIDLDKFVKLVDENYVILKEGVIITCRGCGKEHKPRKILYKKKEHYTLSRPHCPICNSKMLKKIKISSKILAAATLGTFALPYNSKTYECQNCNYRF